jgi:1,2-phenylacetyl-CoA epoxidase PaaB subunit
VGDPARGYAVYARHDKERRVHQVGEVHATSEDDAVVFAYTLYDERRWQDLFIVPQAAIVSLIRPE